MAHLLMILLGFNIFVSFAEGGSSQCKRAMPDLPSACSCSEYTNVLEAEKLWKVTCSNVELEGISAKLSTNVAYLDYTNTSIHSVSVNMLQNYTRLQELLLSHNLIVEIKPGTFLMQSDLVKLKLDHNLIYEIKENAFMGLVSLRELDLGFNLVAGNAIKMKAFEEVVSLQTLNLRDNNIVSLQSGVFENLKALKSLILRGNAIKVLSAGLLKGLAELKTLDLSENDVDDVETNAYERSPFLEKLFLNDNLLQIDFENGLFTAISNFKYVKVLGLGGNHIPFIKSAGRFDLLIMYQDLNISHSSLSVIHNGSLNRLRYLKVLHLHNNPLLCDCKMRWINQWLTNRRISLRLTKPKLTTCALPQAIKDDPLTDTVEENFICSCDSCGKDFSCLGGTGTCNCNSTWVGTSCLEVCSAPATNFKVCSKFTPTGVTGANQKCFCSDTNSYLIECPQNSNWINNSCVCDQGFSGNTFQSCQDIDECTTDTHICHQHAKCINTVGSHWCFCRNGYTGNGVSCKGVGNGLTKAQLIAIGASLGCVLVVVVITIFIFYCWRIRRAKKTNEAFERQLQLNSCSNEGEAGSLIYTGLCKSLPSVSVTL